MKITPKNINWSLRKSIPYLLILPALIFVLGILGYSVISGSITSLFRVDMFYLERPFVGFKNYINIFQDTTFRNALLRSLIFVFSTVIGGTIIALTLALCLYSINGRMKNVFRGLILIPYLVSGVAAAIMWRFTFSKNAGLVNTIISLFGFDSITWLGDPNRAFVAVTVANVWFISPFSALILLAGLQSIDRSLFDAASVDGASRYVIFRQIILPLLQPAMGISLIWLTFASFNMFDIILPMTGGGPGRSTELLAVYMYGLAFRDLNYSSASVVMIVLLIFNLTVSWFYLRAFERRD